MIPHERSLVERLADAPFALVGINTDDDKQEYLREAEEMGVTWRSSWQGSTDGPIPTEWGIEGYPTLYLLDHEGRIREIYLGSPGAAALDAAVDALVVEARAALEAPKQGPQGPAESWEELEQEYADTWSAWRKRPRAERGEHPALGFLERVRSHAEAGEGRAKLWVLTSFSRLNPEGLDVPLERYLVELVRDHPREEWMQGMVGALRFDRYRLGDEQRDKLLRSWIASGAHPEVFPELLFVAGLHFGTAPAPELQAEGLACLRLLLADFPDSSFAGHAEGGVFRITSLQPGMQVPDFTTVDVDGVEFSLSDYRGKVVLLDYWGFW